MSDEFSQDSSPRDHKEIISSFSFPLIDMATQHSQKCCEELVAAGAVGTLLKLISSLSRSLPDQEVTKHALSTLRNLSRYPHLINVLIDSCGSVETILREFLRYAIEIEH